MFYLPRGLADHVTSTPRKGTHGGFPSMGERSTPVKTNPGPSDLPSRTCRVCGNVEGNRPFTLREMMFGSRERFDYFQCGTCETVQIVAVPADLGKYYPGGRYFSLSASASASPKAVHRTLSELEFRAFARPSLGHGSAWYGLLRAFDLTEPGVEAVGRANPRRDSSILEVGCGNGRLLRLLAQLGFGDLHGIDPFLDADVHDDALTLEKKEVADLDRGAFFDVIVLYHSLEHVPDPISTLRAVRDHLSGDGVAIVAMPIVNAAFRTYGTNWYQLDPPRHLHLFSTKSFEIALARSGLRLAQSYFNSTAAQFRISEGYAQDIALSETPPPLLNFGRARFPQILSSREARWRSKAHALNERAEGDQAVFYLRRRSDSGRAN